MPTGCPGPGGRSQSTPPQRAVSRSAGGGGECRPKPGYMRFRPREREVGRADEARNHVAGRLVCTSESLEVRDVVRHGDPALGQCRLEDLQVRQGAQDRIRDDRTAVGTGVEPGSVVSRAGSAARGDQEHVGCPLPLRRHQRVRPAPPVPTDPTRPTCIRAYAEHAAFPALAALSFGACGTQAPIDGTCVPQAPNEGIIDSG